MKQSRWMQKCVIDLWLHWNTLPFESTILLKILIQGRCPVTDDEDVPKEEKCQALHKL